MMRIQVGEVEALFRYPVKSMAGQSLQTAGLGWHGLGGDRRLAFRRPGDRSGFPWLTASKLPELILFAPQWLDDGDKEALPTHVRTPEGTDLPLFSEELAADVSRRIGSAVEMTHLNRGIFDEASVSLIASATVEDTCRQGGQRSDVRRFRPNVLIKTARGMPFEEDDWLGGVLTFGEGDDAAAVSIVNRDERCAMVNYDPDSARPDPQLLKTIVQERANLLGVYGTTIRRGRLAVGQPIFFDGPGVAKSY
jgi:uncharacterized protein